MRGPQIQSFQDDGPFAELPLGDAVGLSQFGAYLERLPPDSRSFRRRWHETEDELIYLISGELILIEEEESVLRAGEAAGWKAGDKLLTALKTVRVTMP